MKRFYLAPRIRPVEWLPDRYFCVSDTVESEFLEDTYDDPIE